MKTLRMSSSTCGVRAARSARLATMLMPSPRMNTRVFSAEAPAVTVDESTEAPTVPDLASMVDILKTAAKDSSVPVKQVLQTIMAVEKMKLNPDGWEDLIAAPDARWLLVYSANTKEVLAATKGQPGRGGFYIPSVACQKYADSVFTNGIFLGDLFYLTFSGPFKMEGRKAEFDVVDISIGVGPWSTSFPLKNHTALTEVVVAVNSNDKETLKTKLPFFLYAYVDEEIMVARGRSGGLAIWTRVDSEWQSKNGVLRVYK